VSTNYKYKKIMKKHWSIRRFQLPPEITNLITIYIWNNIQERDLLMKGFIGKTIQN